jgi:protein MpaA
VAVPASAPAHRELLGRSVQGRPIVAYEVGDPAGIPVLVVGCIHGNEPAGIAVARYLLHNPPAGLDLWIVPVLNPDGRVHKTRGNAHGVDLNRNFPYRWRRLGGVYYSGRRPLSEVEARIAHSLILRTHPSVSVWFHQHLDLVWASGGNLRVERRFAEVSGLPYRHCHRSPEAPSTGGTMRFREQRRSRQSFRRARPHRRPWRVMRARCSPPRRSGEERLSDGDSRCVQNCVGNERRDRCGGPGGCYEAA